MLRGRKDLYFGLGPGYAMGVFRDLHIFINLLVAKALNCMLFLLDEIAIT